LKEKYFDIYTDTFGKNIKKYSAIKNQAKKKIDRILQNPYHNTEPLLNKTSKKKSLNLLGFRSYRIDRNFRIIFVICEEWIKLKSEKQKVANCSMCKDLFKENSKTIIFLTVAPHDIAYQE